MNRFRHLEAPARLSARWNISHDPLFLRLADFVRAPQTILDVGCGYGTPAVWLLTLYPEARIFAWEKNPKKAAIATQVLGPAGKVTCGEALGLTDLSENPDLVLMLDVIHYLTDADLSLTLQSLQKKIRKDGLVLIRTDFPGSSNRSWKFRLEHLRLALEGQGPPIYRTQSQLAALATGAGFKVDLVEPCAPGQSKTWVGMRP